MIEIENQADLTELDKKNISPLVSAYIKNYYFFVCKQFEVSDLTSIGGFFLLENRKDCLKYKKAGLSAPFEQSVFEFAELLTLRSGKEEVKLWHCLFVLTNDNAISLFVSIETIGANLEACLRKDYTERIIYIDDKGDKQYGY